MNHLFLSILWLSACGLLGPSIAAQSGRPNILLIVADDLGVDAVGAYGEGANPPPTPNIDGLAAGGLLFRNAWAYASCSPTRACLHTGRHAFRTFVGAIPTNGGGIMDAGEITLPEVLDRAGTGYAHALIGKWHLGQRFGGALAPNQAGWSHYAGLLPGSQSYFVWPRTVNGVTATSRTYATTKMVDDALSWIQARNEPWLCVLSFTAPHTPYHAPPTRLHTQSLEGKDPESKPRPFFRAMVQAMDNEIGRLLASLGPSLQNTDVIFVGDNGTSGTVTDPPFVVAHGKGTPYEGGVNVPLIVSGPSVRSPGREESALVSAVDLFATVAELAGADLTATIPAWVPIDSVSMVPYLASANQTPLRATVFAENFIGGDWSATQQNGFATIRNDRFKLIRRYPLADGVAHDELYDLGADPFEASDLLTDPLRGDSLTDYDALRHELERLRRPRADVVLFGPPSCAGSHGDPEIGVTGVPRLGEHYAVRLAQAPPSTPVTLLTGTSTTAWGQARLPIDLSSIGAGAGCLLHHSVEVAIQTSTDAVGRVSLSVAVPETGAIVGNTVFHTWLVTDPGAPNNARGITTSRAAAAVIGF